MSDQVKETVKQIFNELADSLETGQMGRRIKIGLTIDGSELGLAVMKEAAYQVKKANLFELVLIGSATDWTGDFQHIATADCQRDAHEEMTDLLDRGELDGCVTLHYNFPIGVSTVGKVVTPAFGRQLFIATTTGTASAERNEAMVRNTVHGIAAAKASGIANPSVGILNIEGAKAVERALLSLQKGGYAINFGESQRADGGLVLRGNDLLMGSVDVVVCDSLTGNLLMKLFSAYTSGGNYEVSGSGYGPGIGKDYARNICIISRASGAPVIANALKYAYQLAKGQLAQISREEYRQAEAAGLLEICQELSASGAPVTAAAAPPEKEIVTSEIAGIEIMELEEAVQLLWQQDIYAESGMGCTGPVILVNQQKAQAAKQALTEANYL